MGSGCSNCNSFNSNSCTDIIPSECIRWQGNAYEEFDICLGDTLTEINTFILDTLGDLLQGKTNELTTLDLTDCTYLNNILDTDTKNLINILTTYKTGICTLNNNFTNIQDTINSFTVLNDYTLGCLDPLSDPCDGDITFHTLIQSIITKLCTLNTSLNDFATNLTDAVNEIVGNYLVDDAIISPGGNGITTTGSGSSGVVSINALVPPFCPILYTGSLGLFDGGGIGLTGTTMDGWFLCNGSNGTMASTSLAQNGGNSLKYIMRFT